MSMYISRHGGEGSLFSQVSIDIIGGNVSMAHITYDASDNDDRNGGGGGDAGVTSRTAEPPASTMGKRLYQTPGGCVFNCRL